MSRAGSPLSAGAWRGAITSALVLALLALAAGGVRVLPWLLDAELPPAIALPFARSVATLALEAALLVGWPVGWALAAFAMVERGEARVLATLGESPLRTSARLVPQAVLLGGLLAAVSVLGARDATAPGRVVTELLARGAAACDAAERPLTLTVPFVGATWLCDPSDASSDASRPSRPMRVLAGTAPGFALFFTAHAARVSPDLRRIELDDAWIALPPRPPGTGASEPPASPSRMRLHATSIAIRGLPPLARASSVPPFARALALALAAALAALAAAWLVLRAPEPAVSRLPARLRALALGAAGPLAALGLLRAIERADVLPVSVSLATAALPIASLATTLAVGLLVRRA